MRSVNRARPSSVMSVPLSHFCSDAECISSSASSGSGTLCSNHDEPSRLYIVQPSSASGGVGPITVARNFGFHPSG